MALTVNNIDVMQGYLCGVIDRADHHAGGVDKIALAIAGAILWRKDSATSIKVMTKSGDAKNVLWVVINKQRYAFSYNHQAKVIEMREKSMQGAVLHSFSNKTSLTVLKATFASL